VKKQMQHSFKVFTTVLQEYVDRVWFPGFLAVLGFLDVFLVVLPNDGLLISSTMLRPKKWFWLGLGITVGSTLGSLVLAGLVQLKGLPWILSMYPGIDQSHTWVLTEKFFGQYGLLLVFGMAASPFFQQPSVILASLARTPLTHLALALFIGRLLKFLLFAYIASHAPRLITRIWGLKGELEEVGVIAPPTDEKK
jgi:membrane protein YqaA with SNARE-associated domain